MASWNLKQLEESLLIGSTLVEGSTLTEAEARQVLAGRTIVGHSVTEFRELTNYRAAVNWLAKQLEASPYLSRDLLLGFHRILMQGLSDDGGTFKTHANFSYRSSGERHEYVAPAHVDTSLTRWLTCFNRDEKKAAIKYAANLYYDFEQIHPFADGNGRIGRLLVAFWLHHHASLRFFFYAKDRIAHLQALEAANEGNLEPLVTFFRERTEKIR